jgi:hypothetical protein
MATRTTIGSLVWRAIAPLAMVTSIAGSLVAPARVAVAAPNATTADAPQAAPAGDANFEPALAVPGALPGHFGF